MPLPKAVPVTSGLPRDAEGVTRHISGYKGVGKRSAEQLVEAFGATGVFRAMDNDPDRIRDVLGAKRAEALLDAWDADPARPIIVPEPAQPKAPAKTARRGTRGGRGGRGGRGRGPKKTSS